MFQTPDEIRRIIDNIKADLTYRHDGPITLFVLISRATRKVMMSPGYRAEINDALHECITERLFVEAPATTINTADA